MKKTALALLSLWLFAYSIPSSFASPQFTEMIGSRYHDPAEKAAESLSRGLKNKRKAAGEPDPEKRRKLLLRAKEDLSKSVGYHENFEALLALGQVCLALDLAEAARTACARALGLKPANSDAKECFDKGTAVESVAKPSPGTS